MRNDARPIGEAGRQSPVPCHPESSDRVTLDRLSHIVNRGTDEQMRRDDADTDPTMPAGGSTLRTRI